MEPQGPEHLPAVLGGGGQLRKTALGTGRNDFNDQPVTGKRVLTVPDFLCAAWPQFPHQSKSSNNVCPSPRPFLPLSLASSLQS